MQSDFSLEQADSSPIESPPRRMWADPECAKAEAECVPLRRPRNGEFLVHDSDFRAPHVYARPLIEPDDRPLEWLWHGYLPQRRITLLTGRGDAGKTTLMASLVGRMAAGGTLLGARVEPARVLIVTHEMSERWQLRPPQIRQRPPPPPHLRHCTFHNPASATSMIGFGVGRSRESSRVPAVSQLQLPQTSQSTVD